MQLKVNTPRGDDEFVDLCDDEKDLEKITVENLRGIICDKLRIVGNIWIVYQGETLEDSQTLAECQIQHMSKVQTGLVLPGGHF